MPGGAGLVDLDGDIFRLGFAVLVGRGFQRGEFVIETNDAHRLPAAEDREGRGEPVAGPRGTPPGDVRVTVELWNGGRSSGETGYDLCQATGGRNVPRRGEGGSSDALCQQCSFDTVGGRD